MNKHCLIISFDIKQLEFDNLVLKDQLETLDAEPNTVSAKLDHKTYSTATRMHMFDCITHKMPTANIPGLVQKFYKRSGIDIDSYTPT